MHAVAHTMSGVAAARWKRRKQRQHMIIAPATCGKKAMRKPISCSAGGELENVGRLRAS